MGYATASRRSIEAKVAAMSAEGLHACEEKMRADGVHEVAIETFAHYYRALEAGESGLLGEEEIEPVAALEDADDLPEVVGVPLDRTVVISLNGGLGTSMGMTGPKSLLEVKDGLSFLDISARQVLALRERSGARIPLVLMNSFATREASLEALSAYPDLAVDGIPADFVQNKVPKLRAEDLLPAEWPADPGLEWAPPGHGDLYTALQTSGMLSALIDGGYRYAFVSNVDNLGAVLDERILAWFAGSGAPFAMEAADRTAADRKGGHLARRAGDGGLVLREVAQTPEADLGAFQDVSRHRFFNTNTLWLDLEQLAAALAERDGVLGLPMIVNRKTVDPSERSSTPVLQLETAMGAAIGVFDGATALRVPRTRFAPVKATSDLLVLRSDAYSLSEDARLVPVADPLPLVSLSDDYKLVGDFEARFPSGAPSLVECERLTIEADVTFGADVVVVGDVLLDEDGELEDGAQLTGWLED